MNDQDKGLKAVESGSGQGAGRLPGSRLQVIAAAVGLAVLLVGGVQWSHRDAGAEQAAQQPESSAQAEPTAFDYFPAQYVNQAKEVEEHIQAF
jgi:hypothetical protein